MATLFRLQVAVSPSSRTVDYIRGYPSREARRRLHSCRAPPERKCDYYDAAFAARRYQWTRDCDFISGTCRGLWDTRSHRRAVFIGSRSEH